MPWGACLCTAEVMMHAPPLFSPHKKHAISPPPPLDLWVQRNENLRWDVTQIRSRPQKHPKAGMSFPGGRRGTRESYLYCYLYDYGSSHHWWHTIGRSCHHYDQGPSPCHPCLTFLMEHFLCCFQFGGACTVHAARGDLQIVVTNSNLRNSG